MCALCSVYCAVSTKQAQRLQTVLCLHDINATMMSKKWKGSYSFGPKYRSKWRWLSHGCRKVSISGGLRLCHARWLLCSLLVFLASPFSSQFPDSISVYSCCQGCQMVPNLANIAKNHCFPKNLPIFWQYFFMPKHCHFLNIKCDYWY